MLIRIFMRTIDFRNAVRDAKFGVGYGAMLDMGKLMLRELKCKMR